MIYIHLNDMLEAKGKTAYWLSRVAGIPHVTVWNLTRKETQASINLSVLSRICSALECLPADLLRFVPDAEDKAVVAMAKSQPSKRRATPVEKTEPPRGRAAKPKKGKA
jgi:DNA-binding Xre family transcriptional regulator